MKCKILHESKNRIRIHTYFSHMKCEEADIIEYYIKSLPYVIDVRVSERTSNAIIKYNDKYKDLLIKNLSGFDLYNNDVEVPEQTGRYINHEYTDKLFFHILKRGINRLLIPLPVRSIITVVKSLPFVVEGVKSLLKGKIEVPLLDATSIVVSLARGDFDTAGSVMFLLGVGDIMDEWTRKKSVDDLARAMALNIDKVWIITDEGNEVLVPINKIQIEDEIIVRMGNVIPLDGVVKSGEAEVNQATITGEGLPVRKTEGGFVYAGTVVEEGEIIITVKNRVGNGQYDRIAKMIEESEKLKSKTEERALKVADKLVPYTFGATILTYLLTRNATRAISILMVDFCCAIKLSMPIAVLSAMREASNYHIMVKGGKYLETISKADTIVFDKTGTLTYANPKVKYIVPFDGMDEDEALRLSACLEEHYPHSMANAVVAAAAERGLGHEEKHSKVEYVVAHGIASSIDGQKVVIGSYHFVVEDEGCIIDDSEMDKFKNLSNEYSHLYLAIGGRVKAAIMIEDPVKEDAAEIVDALKEMGLKVVMLTGDSSRVAKRVARELCVDECKAQVLPEDKAEFIRKEHELGRTCIMVGDGVNDTLALSEADVGIAINSGAAIAREVCDIVVSEDKLETLITLRKLGRALEKRTKTNYEQIVSFNSMLILLGALGVLTPTMTALLHNGSTVLISLESMRDLLI